MAYLLRSEQNTNLINLASSISIGTSDGFVFEFKTKLTTFVSLGHPVICNSATSNETLNLINTDSLITALRFGNGSNINFSQSVDPTVETVWIITKEFGNISVSANGTQVLAPTANSSNLGTMNRLLARGGGTDRTFIGDIYYFKLSKNGELLHNWDADASNGTGSTLPDTVGSNDGTLVNFPTNDSQWVFYSTGIEQAVGLVTETNSTFALGKAKAKAVGLSSTTDSALALSTAIVQAVGLVSETNATFALNSTKSKAVGLNSETNTSFSATAIKAGGAVVGLATDTNIALSTTSAKVKAVGIASDTSTALAATASKSRTVGQASTTDTANSLGILKALAIGLASDTNTAITLSTPQTVTVGLVTETNSALALATLGLAPWVYTVPAEARIIVVSAEARSYTVPIETRTIEVS